jgi:ParB-like chromosome segregation protein Spo0J
MKRGRRGTASFTAGQRGRRTGNCWLGKGRDYEPLQREFDPANGRPVVRAPKGSALQFKSRDQNTGTSSDESNQEALEARGGKREIVRLELLLSGNSPRLGGEDPRHVERLAAADTELPPVLVHRLTMRIVDGTHRVLAAQLRGDSKISVEYFDGTAFEAFVQSVRANVRHGLPLTKQDREVAAKRILEVQPQWSDRAVADVTGLSAPTVAEIRMRATDSSCQSHRRIGKDGRVRPLSTAEGRRIAARIIEERPDTSLRDIARSAGISAGTARDVRKRLQRGDDPVPAKYSAAVPLQPPLAVPASPDLWNLRKDPSLRFNDAGRALLQWLGICDMSEGQRHNLVRVLPDYRRDTFADLALQCAERWRKLAEELQRLDRDTA